MPVYQLPIFNDFNNFQQSQGLDGRRYTFKFRYNARNDTWYVELLNDSNEILLGPKPCLTNVIQQTGRIKPFALPMGDIIFLDVSGSGLDCTLDNFGDAVGLFYSNVEPAS
jgi:hypothetical protein